MPLTKKNHRYLTSIDAKILNKIANRIQQLMHYDQVGFILSCKNSLPYLKSIKILQFINMRKIII